MRRSLLSVLAAALLSAASVVAAQQRPIVVAGASGRFETQLDPKTAVSGFSTAQTKAFRGQLDRLVTEFRGMPTVNTPPSPICHRLMSWIEIIPPHGVLSGRVEVLRPINFNGGKCNAMTGGGVQISVNRADALVESRYINAYSVEGGPGRWYVLPVRKIGNGRITLEGNVVAMVRPGASPFRPVSIERYLKEKSKDSPQSEAAQKLATLPAASRGLSACVGADGMVVGQASCAASRTVVEINPAYFDKSRPSDMQMLVVQTPNGRSSESAADEAARMAMWQALDLDALQAMVR